MHYTGEHTLYLSSGLTSTMGEYTAILYTVIILRKGVDTATLIGSTVMLEIDETYTIGKSIAVLKDSVVIGHLERYASRVVCRFLRSCAEVQAHIYSDIRNRQNQAWYTVLSHSFECTSATWNVKTQSCSWLISLTLSLCRMTKA